MMNKAQKAVKEHNMLSVGDKVIVALSGGADSMALLSFLREISGEYSLTIFAAHINHCLRGEESDRDEEFVRRYCKESDIPLFIHRADISSAAEETGESIEQAGRRIRYAFLSKKAEELGALVATAHTLSDSLETMLFNLTRGTALKGLCGIPPKRGNIIRPLIYCTRDEIEEYCRDRGIPYIVDSTNADTAYKRNFIRQKIVPQLLHLNPSLYNSVTRTQKILRQDEEYLNSKAQRALSRARQDEGYSLEKLISLPAAIRSRAIIMAVETHTGRQCEAVHLKAIENQLKKGRGKVSLGDNFALVTQGILTFTGPPAVTPLFAPLEIGTVDIDGKIVAKTALVSIENFKKSKKFNKKLLTISLDYDMIQGNARFTARQPGDCFRQPGRGITKSIKKLFNELKIPVHIRDSLLFLRDEAGILWIEGIGPAERCRITESTQNVLIIEIERG